MSDWSEMTATPAGCPAWYLGETRFAVVKMDERWVMNPSRLYAVLRFGDRPNVWPRTYGAYATLDEAKQVAEKEAPNA